MKVDDGGDRGNEQSHVNAGGLTKRTKLHECEEQAQFLMALTLIAQLYALLECDQIAGDGMR